MDTQQGLSIKQHINYLLVSLLVSGIALVLDFHYGNLQHGVHAPSAATHTLPSEIIMGSYEVAHSTVLTIEV